jgi:autotransporter adhesin
MNQIFKTFFSNHLNRMVVTSEKSNATCPSSTKNVIFVACLLTQSPLAFAFSSGIENGIYNIAIGESAVTTGTSSISLGTGSIAIGSNLTNEQLNNLLNQQKSLVSDISSIKTNIKLKEKEYIDSINTIDKVERNLQAIESITKDLDAEKGKTIDITNRWNLITSQYEEKSNINNEKIKLLNNIDISQITDTWETDGGLDKLASKLQQNVEKDSNFSFGSDFYKDYIKKYINVEKNVNYDSKRYDAIAGEGLYQSGIKAEGYNNTQKAIRFTTSTQQTELQMYSFIKDQYYSDSDFEVIKNENTKFYNDFITNFDSKINALKKQDNILENLLDDSYISKLKGDLQETFDRNNRTIRKLELDKILRYQDQNDPLFSSLFKERQELINQGVGTQSLDKITTDYNNKRDQYKYERLTSLQEENANNINKIKNALSSELAELKKQKTDIDTEIENNKNTIANFEKEITNRQPTPQELEAYNKAKESEAQLEADRNLLAKKEGDLKNVQSGLGDGENAIAIGTNSLASGKNSMALGTRAKAVGEETIAIGTDSKALNKLSIAIGKNSLAEENSSIAIGNNTVSSNIGSIAIGDGAEVKSNNGIALGAGSISRERSDNIAYMATGTNILIPTANSGELSIGDNDKGIYRQITGVAAGSLDSDAVNIAQLKAVNENIDNLSYISVKYNPDKSQINLSGTTGTKITNLKDAELSHNSKDAVNGSQLFTTNQNVYLNTINIKNVGEQVQINTNDIRNITNNISNITTSDLNSVKYNQDKSQINLTGENGTKISNVKDGEVSALSKDAVNGSQLFKTNQNVIKNTNDIKYIGDQVQINTNDIRNITNNISNITTSDLNSVKYNQDKSQIDLTGENGTKISNVKEGELNAKSSDAVNGAQLFETNQNVSKNTNDIKKIGDQVNIHSNEIKNMGDQINTNTIDIKNITNNMSNLIVSDKDSVKYNSNKSEINLIGENGTKISNLNNGELSETSKDAVNGSQLFQTNQNLSKISSNIKNIDTQVKSNTSDIKIIEKNVEELNIADQNNVKYNADKTQINLNGSSGTKIINLKAGEVSSTSKEAINGSQLYLAKQDVIRDANAYTDSIFAQYDKKVDRLSRKTNSGIASALALASIGQPTDAGYSMVSLATGTWGGESSLAIGTSGVTEDSNLFGVKGNYIWKLAGTSDNSGKLGGGASINFQWK